ncbi:hypothetical protein G6F65_022041 [Rhizopus arrhizus]|nr:hypothetical protein G6F65_022041 [Rhizopus arrhizus]
MAKSWIHHAAGSRWRARCWTAATHPARPRCAIWTAACRACRAKPPARLASRITPSSTARARTSKRARPAR